MLHIRQNGRVNCRKTYCGILMKSISRDAAMCPGIARQEMKSSLCPECVRVMDGQPRAKTKQEVVDELIDHISGMIKYWENEDRRPDIRGKLEGLAFSILVMLDGGGMSLPSFDMIPNTHPSDKEYHKEHGESWYPSIVINDEVQLHELFARRKK
jgi:hypothetical protein